MDWALLNMNGVLFLFRWIHFVAGVIWIGLLYYFNFVQGEFFKEIEAGTKNIAISKLVPRALWWFRWTAMITFISGVFLILGTLHSGVPLVSSWGVLILIGGTLGTVMFLNVWLVIWPNQKVVIASAQQVLGGGKALDNAAACGAKAGLASRSNVLFSIPMLFFMGAGRHLILSRDLSQVNLWYLAISVGLVILLLEINSLKGKMGPMTTIRGVMTSGVLLTAVLYLLVEATTR